ncbi:unnamed protein product [Mytilus coruscus]|uniref:Integrase catalytic domain-containing protein n=1 Tax=Mytilus coruscus TaxID=42192 RepID=A0A6J8CC50_MYTCO|nr:unnamed protein product [Mytilus coruscus]
MAIIKYEQNVHFEEEIHVLQNIDRGKVLKKSSKLFKLNPFIDDNGLLRVRGRLERADLPYDAKHPIILPKDSNISKLIIEDIHRSVGHLDQTRKKFSETIWGYLYLSFHPCCSLEIAHSMDTDSCINAIRRLISRRGNPEFIRSDNGTNLVGAEREMREEIERWNIDKINDFMLQKSIKMGIQPSCRVTLWRRVGEINKISKKGVIFCHARAESSIER